MTEQMEKNFLVSVDGVPTFYLPIASNNKIGDIKKFLNDKYKNYSIKMFINSQTELKTFSTNKYNDMTFESIFDKILNGKIELNIVKNKIRIAQQAKGRSYPIFQDYEVIPAWSRGRGEWKELSPFYIHFEDGVIFENFWQSNKVWREVGKQKTANWNWPSEVHLDKDNNPNDKWIHWHKTLKHHNLPVRRPNGKAIPLYAYFNGEKLDIIEARKKIYIPYLKQLYRKNPVYQQLLEKVKSGKNIIIVEPDGPLLDLYPDGLEVNLTILNDLIEKTNYDDLGVKNKYRPYGHGYVLAMCLLEDS